MKQNEIADLLKVCKNDPSPIGARDAALIAILSGSGLRRSEAVALEVTDFDSETGALQVRNGKGRKFRIVLFASRCDRCRQGLVGGQREFSWCSPQSN